MPELEKKIKNRSAKIGIVGLGFVGLPLAVAFAELGFKVIGFDVQKKRADLVNQGKPYIDDVSRDRLSSVVRNKCLEATTQQNRLGEPDVICICVPTPLTKTKDPDLSYVTSEAKKIAKLLRSGQLVILESTTYPGTTREVLLPILENFGMKVGKDFYLAFSPERVDPGNKKYTVKNTPKIVGGIEPTSTKLAQLLYSQIVNFVVPVSSTDVAEMVKIFENVYRNVNIALVNELAQLCQRMGLSIWEVVDAASTKPYGFMPFYPGPGVGGHCTPIDPYYLATKAREYDFHTRFIQVAAIINDQMPYYVVSCIGDALDSRCVSMNGARVLVLGVAYKPDVGDIRESPALKIIELLQTKRANVSYNDPYVPQLNLSGNSLRSVDITKKSLSSMDCVLIATNHSCYDFEQVTAWSKLVFDTRGVTREIRQPNIVRLGE